MVYETGPSWLNALPNGSRLFRFYTWNVVFSLDFSEKASMFLHSFERSNCACTDRSIGVAFCHVDVTAPVSRAQLTGVLRLPEGAIAHAISLV